MKKIGYRSFLSGAVVCALIIVSCGSGSSTTSDSGKGNAISGTVQIGGNFLSLTQNRASQAKVLGPYSSSKVLLVNRIGNILDLFDTDGNGNFSFGGLEHNDYIIRVVDAETLSIVTEVKCSLVNGDDATITGVVTPGEANWVISFTANDSVILQRESQQINARDLSDASGKPFDEIISMRTNGMGWGEIALALSVSPGILGLTYEQGFVNEKMTEVTDGNIGPSSKT